MNQRLNSKGCFVLLLDVPTDSLAQFLSKSVSFPPIGPLQ
jgi:hypothetical protein